MSRQFEKIRKIAKQIESGNAQFSTLYAYLDKLQATQHESDSDDEVDMQKYIKPVKKMLHSYKRSIETVKQHNDVIEQALMGQYRPKENSSDYNQTKTKRFKAKSVEAISMEQLDQQIDELQQRIKMMR